MPTITLIQPVLAKPFHRDGWIFEEKYDGCRMLLQERRHVRLVSRRGVHSYPVVLGDRRRRRPPARTLILDGEVAVFDQKLSSAAAAITQPVRDCYGRDTRPACFKLCGATSQGDPGSDRQDI